MKHSSTYYINCINSATQCIKLTGISYLIKNMLHTVLKNNITYWMLVLIKLWLLKTIFISYLLIFYQPKLKQFKNIFFLKKCNYNLMYKHMLCENILNLN
jgi:hypothetical protein